MANTSTDRLCDEALALRTLTAAGYALSAYEVGVRLGHEHNSTRRAEIARALDRLARRGDVRREVRREFDRQTSARSSWYFGGAGSMVRLRAYYSIK